MKIMQLKLLDCDIPLKIPFRQSVNVRNSSQGILAEVVTRDGVRGYGECLPREYVSGETRERVVSDAAAVARELMGRRFEGVGDISAWSAWAGEFLSDRPYRATCTRCALEMSLLDAWGKTSGHPVGRLLGTAATNRIAYSGIMTGSGSLHADLILGFLREMGLHQVKVKVGRDMDADLALIRRVRSALGSGVDLRVDVNGAWSLDKAVDRIPLFLGQGVRDVEQPLSSSDRHAYLELKKAVPPGVSVWLDESVCTLADAEWFISRRAVQGINLKISKNGGLLNCRAIAALARENGVRCQLGAQVGETSLITAAGQVLAGLEGDLSFHEGAFGTYLLARDIVAVPLVFGHGGEVSLKPVFSRPGIGVAVHTGAVDALPCLGEFSDR